MRGQMDVEQKYIIMQFVAGIINVLKLYIYISSIRNNLKSAHIYSYTCNLVFTRILTRNTKHF